MKNIETKVIDLYDIADQMEESGIETLADDLRIKLDKIMEDKMKNIETKVIDLYDIADRAEESGIEELANNLRLKLNKILNKENK